MGGAAAPLKFARTFLLGILAYAPALVALADPRAAAGPGCDLGTLTQAVNDRPEDPNVYANRANCLLTPAAGNQRPSNANIKAAIKDLEHALKLDPGNYASHHNLGHAAAFLKYEDFAIYEFNWAIKINPKSAESYVGRGWAYFESCKLKEASADFQQAARLDATTRPRIPTSPRLSSRKTECAKPPPRPSYLWLGPQADPYFDHDTDYWRERKWERPQ